MSAMLDAAIILAIQAHAGQLDRMGDPYVLHPLRVMASLPPQTPAIVRAAAVLHDVVEDTSVHLPQIQGFLGNTRKAEQVASLVRALTHDDGEEYGTYIRRIQAHSAAAVQVKLADIRDNRRPGVTKTGLRKYAAAEAVLLGGYPSSILA